MLKVNSENVVFVNFEHILPLFLVFLLLALNIYKPMK